MLVSQRRLALTATPNGYRDGSLFGYRELKKAPPM
jgi:hypothetical protein